jgi:hypothetical protein
MARPNVELICALRDTAHRLEHGATYKWSHFGQCNCGNLAQTITQLSPREVYEAAFRRSGDWGEQAREFCPTSGYPIDFVLSQLFAIGMEPEDVRQLERLSDDRVLRRLGQPPLLYSRREDVIAYMYAWADLLDDERALPVTYSLAAE